MSLIKRYPLFNLYVVGTCNIRVVSAIERLPIIGSVCQWMFHCNYYFQEEVAQSYIIPYKTLCIKLLSMLTGSGLGKMIHVL